MHANDGINHTLANILTSCEVLTTVKLFVSVSQRHLAKAGLSLVEVSSKSEIADLVLSSIAY